MQQTLIVDMVKQLNTESGCLAITTSEDELNLIHPNDVWAVVIENNYCQITIPALLLCIEYQIVLLICNEKHQPEIYCLDYYRHTELR